MVVLLLLTSSIFIYLHPPDGGDPDGISTQDGTRSEVDRATFNDAFEQVKDFGSPKEEI